jgi:tetratricopeptide (TPR) repeat protein
MRASEVAELEEAERARQAAAKAEANIQFDLDISGLNETEAALVQLPKPQDWYVDVNAACGYKKQSLEALRQRIATLEDPNAGGPGAHRTAYDLLAVRIAHGQYHIFFGEPDKAVEQWEIAYGMAQKEIPRYAPYVEKLLGMGYLQKAQTFNDVYRHPGDRCIFPIDPRYKFTKTEDSDKAIQYLTQTFQAKPTDLEARWLLNLAHMMAGTYPSGVPKEALIPPSAFASAEDIGRFKDVAPEAGINLFSEAGGLIVDDFENNGLFDIVTSNWDLCAPMHYFHNNGDGTFSDHTAKSGLDSQVGGLNIVQADYNNDGCVDVLVLRGGWETGQRKSLLRNNCDGTFTDVTKEAGLAMPATSTQAGVWLDINNDGYLDLFIGNENGSSQLFLNNGNGTFTDIAHAAGVDRVMFAKGAAAEDYDHDGYMDLYVSNYRGDNVLFHNNHDLTFTDVARQAGVTGTGHSFPVWFFDYDNDGWADLLVTSYNMSVAETARNYLGLPHNAGTMKLYKNLGNGAFRDVTVQMGLDKALMPMGSNFGDIDNDGYPDIYLGVGDPSYASLAPHVLFHNKEGKAFVDITASSGTGELHKGHGVAFADIDNDGDEDILTVTGGAIPGDSHMFRLFENPGHGNDWISVKLQGVKANRSALGARIKVTVKNQGRERAVYRTVNSGGSFGASPLEQHIGLGKSAQIVSLEIIWPGDPDHPQKFTNLAVNQAIAIKQGAAEYSKIERHAVRLGGGKRTLAQ